VLSRVGFWLCQGRVGFWVAFRAAEFQLWLARGRIWTMMARAEVVEAEGDRIVVKLEYM